MGYGRFTATSAIGRLLSRFGEVIGTDFVADYETDEIIQKSLREELGKDVTLLTIAHRLQTIMDADKIVSFVLQ